MEAIISFNRQITDRSDRHRIFLIFFSLILLTVFLSTPSIAKDYSFSWSTNSGQVDGYKFYYKKGGSAGPPFEGNDAIEGDSPIIIPDLSAFTVSGLEDNTTYHFALTAYDGLNESDFTDTITVFPGNDKQERIAKVLTIINTYLLLESE